MSEYKLQLPIAALQNLPARAVRDGSCLVAMGMLQHALVGLCALIALVFRYFRVSVHIDTYTYICICTHKYTQQKSSNVGPLYIILLDPCNAKTPIVGPSLCMPEPLYAE